jgi:argininosuccinate lyase
MTHPTDADRFPAPAYAAAVLAPLFAVVKKHHWRDLLRIDRAHAVMLVECGILQAADAAAILRALDAVEADIAARLDSLQYTGAQEDFFFFVAEELRARLGVGIAGRLHTGRSRNDVDQTILKMALKRRVLGLLERLLGVIDGFVAQALKNRDVLIVAYTHGQPAQPTTWGHYLTALTEVLLRDAVRLARAYNTVDHCSMGAAAITTTGFPIDRARMAALLGFARIAENSYAAIAACDYVTETYGAIKLMLINLGRFVQDLGHWTAFEVRQLTVPDGFVQRSSIMPQKRNPVPIEHLRLLSSSAAGQCDTVVGTLHNTPFTDINDNDYTVHETGYGAIDTTHRVLDLVDALVAAIRVDEAAVRRQIDASYITMTELADSLVRLEQIPFTEAHDICSRLAGRMAAARTTPGTVAHDMFLTAFHEIIGRPSTLDEESLRRLTSPDHFVAARKAPGGPAPAPMDEMLAGHHEQVATLRETAASHHRHLDAASGELAACVESLIRTSVSE